MKKQTLQIFRPCVPSRITQGWGENRACLDTATGRIYGVSKGKTCPVSYYHSVGMHGHNGIDIPGITGTEIHHAATFDGWWRSERDIGGGLGVDVVSYKPLFFRGAIPREIKATATPVDGGFLHHVKMRYWHLHTQLGHEGKHITCGTIIGTMGNTGASSGTHLHFAPKWCLEDGRGVGNDNGYYGAFDPTPYYKHTVTAKDHATYITKDAIPLSDQEKKDMHAQLTLLRSLLIRLQEIKNNI